MFHFCMCELLINFINYIHLIKSQHSYRVINTCDIYQWLHTLDIQHPFHSLEGLDVLILDVFILDVLTGCVNWLC